MDFFSDYFSRIAACVRNADGDTVSHALTQVRLTKERGGKIILVGNGGSAAIASHVTVDLVKTAAVRAVNFNEADLLTCLANDYGYEHWVEQALGFYADPNDLVILISSSGKSGNIINGARKAKEMKLKLLTFTGFCADNPLRQMGDINFWVDSTEYNVVEMTHHIWLVAISDYLANENRQQK
jgi:D-sedoheptulose 7-phosphate isomerase